MKRYVILLFILCVMWLAARPQSYSALVFDQNQSAYMGAQNLMTIHHLIYKGTDNYIRDTFFAENTFIRKTSGIGYRLIKLVLFDEPVNHFISLTQHEVFGHAQRFKEFGSSIVFYSMSLTAPYGSGRGYTMGGTPGTEQQSMVLNISGVEANNLLADQITYQVLLDDQMHYSQGILYRIVQNNLFRYLWRTRNQSADEISSSNDMNNYIRGINLYYNQAIDKGYSAKQLSNQSVIGFANPMQLYSLYTAFYTYAFKGQKTLNRIPMIKIGQVRYLPAFTYSITPFGSQYHFVNYVKHKQQLYSAAIEVGDPTFADFYSIALKAFNIVNTPKLSLNAHIDLWNQPELELEKRNTTPAANKYGESIKLDMMYRPFGNKKRAGGFLQLGYKTKGYLTGETLDESYIIRFGLSIHL